MCIVVSKAYHAVARPRWKPIAQAVAERAGGGDFVPRVKLVMSRGGEPPGGDSADSHDGGKGLKAAAPDAPRAAAAGAPVAAPQS